MPFAPAPFDPASCPKARADVDFRRVGGDWVIFDPSTQRMHVLDVTGALVWSYCTGDMTVAAMEAEIRRAVGAALPKGRDSGVQAALRTFLDAGLLEEEAS